MRRKFTSKLDLNPLNHGALYAPPPALVFCPILKISLLNPYLKIFDLTKLFVADARMKKKCKEFSFTPSQSTLNLGPWDRGLNMSRILNIVTKRFSGSWVADLNPA